MKEIANNNNIFLLPRPGRRDAVCVTTNGILRHDGKAVMGAGIAKYARDHFKNVDSVLGNKIRENGNHVYNLGIFNRPDKAAHFMLISFPTKEDWKNNSKPELIRRSCEELVTLANECNLDNIYLPCPGCSNGHLDYWKDVRPILLKTFQEERFIISVPYKF